MHADETSFLLPNATFLVELVVLVLLVVTAVWLFVRLPGKRSVAD